MACGGHKAETRVLIPLDFGLCDILLRQNVLLRLDDTDTLRHTPNLRMTCTRFAVIIRYPNFRAGPILKTVLSSVVRRHQPSPRRQQGAYRFVPGIMKG